MRGLWHSIALIAENAGTFNKSLFTICKSVNDPDLLKSVNLTSNPSDKRKLLLKKQPTKNTLIALDQHLRGGGDQHGLGVGNRDGVGRHHQFDAFDLAGGLHFAQHPGDVSGEMAIFQQFGRFRADPFQ